MRALSLSESSLYPSTCVWFCARAKEIRARAGRSRASRNPRESKGNPRASREIRARAGRFALAHYINLLSRYKNVLSTFGSKITPYQRTLQLLCVGPLTCRTRMCTASPAWAWPMLRLRSLSPTACTEADLLLRVLRARRNIARGHTGMRYIIERGWWFP